MVFKRLFMTWLFSQLSCSPSDPDNSLHVLLPALRPVVYWMSNSLEVFEFLQQDLIPIVRKRVREERLR